ncbi:DUF3421 domain-containing protein [Legionella quateirensis]|uniref:Protein of uncharacterized function (DUF3421) n=1 Tax=Legionella quateirensis TaxID=45072 RepID=A0A378KNG7_9GAMM|nr:DUF3421 domain-containing protein [Legionella quateirensis]KTD52827.1 hypothetical protein Lqua_0660 [Legionella quateirensis]STY16444.1 Protein of uncharacterised function (DUF3421) [Legionella quateirensis]
MFRAIALLFMTLLVSSVFAYPNVHHHQVSPLTNALRTGTDTNGAILYLCQAKLFGSIQPGKTWAGYGRCNVPYGGKEYVVDQFTIPNQRSFGQFNWERDHRSALQIGKDTNGNPLFVCQANFNGSIQPGKTWPGYNHCNISYAGREVITDYFRVLSRQQEIIVGSKIPRGQPNNMHSHY